uniref:Uncharacterized protein n=1 Tax=Oryza brachyantha TaxID=4533 RepID=J3LN75_ORYBR
MLGLIRFGLLDLARPFLDLVRPNTAMLLFLIFIFRFHPILFFISHLASISCLLFLSIPPELY